MLTKTYINDQINYVILLGLKGESWFSGDYLNLSLSKRTFHVSHVINVKIRLTLSWTFVENF